MPSSVGDEGVQLVVGDVADQVRPQPAAPRPHGVSISTAHGASLPAWHEHPQVRASPIFPVADLPRALAHYAALGCTVEHARRRLRLRRPGRASSCTSSSSPDDDRAADRAAAYLHVPDADALAAEWAARRPAPSAPVDTDYGLREGRHVDPDGNLLRFGSPLASARVSEEIRWGVVGPGRIAEKVVEDFAVVDGARAVAVASRSLDRAQAFAARHGIERAHGSYAEILADPDVDVLYVATPHPQHHAIALAALRAGKALLVEKAFTATTAGAARGRRPGAGDRRLRHGGDVDPLPAGRRRAARADRRRRDRRGALGAGRPRRRAGVRPDRPAVRPRRSAAARCSTSASTSSRSRRCCSGRRSASSPPARCSPPAPTPRRRCCSTTATGGRRR